MSKRPGTVVLRDWTDARAKVATEGHCRSCGKPAGTVRLEAAHTVGREHDERRTCDRCGGLGHPQHRPEGKCKPCNGLGFVLWVNPDDIIPLCGPATSTGTCHGKDHAHKLNKVELMTTAEQVRAVTVCKTIPAAWLALGGMFPQTPEEAERAAGEPPHDMAHLPAEHLLYPVTPAPPPARRRTT